METHKPNRPLIYSGFASLHPIICRGYKSDYNVSSVALRGVVEDSSGLRKRGPGFKTRSRPLTFTKAVTEFSDLYMLWSSHELINSVEIRHAKDVKTLELRVIN